MGSRRLARQFAFSILHSLDYLDRSTKKTIKNFWKSCEAEEVLAADEQPLIARKIEDDEQDFAKLLVEGTWKNREIIDDLISKTSLNWAINRIATVDKTILRLAIYELLFEESIPVNVSIDEAIELAKRYGEVSQSSLQNRASSHFVNGILDTIASQYAQEKLEKNKKNNKTKAKSKKK